MGRVFCGGRWQVRVKISSFKLSILKDGFTLPHPRMQMHVPLKGNPECFSLPVMEAWAPLTSLDSATSAFLLATRSFCPDSPLLQHSLPDCCLEAMAQEDISHHRIKCGL